METQVAAAREHQRASREARSLAARHIEQRNHLIKALRREDPERWTYPELAKAIGITEELVAKVIQGRA